MVYLTYACPGSMSKRQVCKGVGLVTLRTSPEQCIFKPKLKFKSQNLKHSSKNCKLKFKHSSIPPTPFLSEITFLLHLNLDELLQSNAEIWVWQNWEWLKVGTFTTGCGLEVGASTTRCGLQVGASTAGCGLQVGASTSG
jgi:hypothetical protein